MTYPVSVFLYSDRKVFRCRVSVSLGESLHLTSMGISPSFFSMTQSISGPSGSRQKKIRPPAADNRAARINSNPTNCSKRFPRCSRVGFVPSRAAARRTPRSKKMYFELFVSFFRADDLYIGAFRAPHVISLAIIGGVGGYILKKRLWTGRELSA